MRTMRVSTVVRPWAFVRQFADAKSPKPAAASPGEIFDSIFGANARSNKPAESSALGMLRGGSAANEAQRAKDVDAIFESLFGKSRKHTDLNQLKYFRLYPEQVRKWIEDAKTPVGLFTKDGDWMAVRVLERDKLSKPTRDATLFLPQRKEVPADLKGKYRFGLTEEQLATAPAKVKDVLSFRWARQKEITSFRAHEYRRQFALNEMDVGSSGVQVGMMTARIRALTEHMRAHAKDKRTKRALTMLVHKRQKHLRYLKRTDVARYYQVVTALNLRDTVATGVKN